MEYGITIPPGDIAEQPSPWKYLTNFARESEQMGVPIASLVTAWSLAWIPLACSPPLRRPQAACGWRRPC